MAFTKSALPTISIVVLLVLAVFALRFIPIQRADASSTISTKSYTNLAYGFMLQMPADFAVYPADGEPQWDENGAPLGQVFVLQSKNGEATQFEITPDGRENPTEPLSIDDVVQQSPGLDPAEVQQEEIAPGVPAFTYTESLPPYSPTDILMFTYRGNLYEISSDMSIRPLAENILSTLTFN